MNSFARLCFGTSTFVAGRLRPDKDSEPGMDALRTALLAGVHSIHSNPKLGTQWAIREVLAGMPPSATPVEHLVKAEAPIGASRAAVSDAVRYAVEASCANLGVPRLFAVVVEADIKRSDPGLHNAAVAVREFYEVAAAAVAGTGLADRTFGYCRLESHLRPVLDCAAISGVAAQYNLTSRWILPHLPAVVASGRRFIGMSPLHRGALVGPSGEGQDRLEALRWALENPDVHAVTITMSSVIHVQKVLRVLSETSASKAGAGTTR